MMKVFVCSSSMYPPFRSSGIGNVIYNNVLQFKKQGLTIDVCVPIGGDINLLNEQIMKNHIDLLYRHEIIRGLYSNIYFWYKVKKFVKKNLSNYDVFWFHNPNHLFIKGFDKAIFTMHSTTAGNLESNFSMALMKKQYYKVLKLLESQFYKKSELQFTAVSATVYQELKILGVNDAKIALIPNGVNTNRFTPLINNIEKEKFKSDLNIPYNHKIILSVGRLIDVKQPEKLVETFRYMQSRNPNLSLIILGDGPLYLKIKKLVSDNDLKNISLMGFVDGDKKLRFYSCADFYIMTSKYEGLPLTLLEAMASGLPCIVPDIPNLKIVEKAECGINVDFSKMEDAVSKILNYINEDNSIYKKNARMYAENNLDWSIVANKYIHLFKNKH